MCQQAHQPDAVPVRRFDLGKGRGRGHGAGYGNVSLDDYNYLLKIFLFINLMGRVGFG